GKRFAQSFCDYLGAKHGLLTTSGSSALKLALCGVLGEDGLGESGECIVPEYTFVACAHTALEMGFSVRFVDVELKSGCLDPDALEAAITDRTRVVMPVDILGHPADMDRINGIARSRGLKVVEDACQAHGASYKGHKCGTLGDAGCFSFQSTKNLTSGEGGFLATDSLEVFKRAHALHNVGRAPEGETFDEPQVGYNYRPSEYVAVLLEQRLAELDAQIARRNDAAAYLTSELKGITGLVAPQPPEWVTNHAWHLYAMRYVPSAFGNRPRSEFLKALYAEGIPCSGGYGTPLSEYPMMQAVKKRRPHLITTTGSENTKRVCAESVWLSQTMLLADRKDLADIPEAIRKIQKAFHA
ncbi:MAG: DegT/DnrJ/EryC1/StrS family aminotransferase, partial [Gemmatimonadetes bacterium]|nr:DegT/DnrJ/EryC1/StrS family aminotransferase [Gemmatimonadota bacterium]